MDVFELSVLAFIFARQKNETLGRTFGPESPEIDEQIKALEGQDLSKFEGNKKERDAMLEAREVHTNDENGKN